ncbi:AsmA family protein [candidate division WOR-3 bacterium]|nr:AsmA family protein [candidate division WOR-3 bacterium]
MTKYLKILLIVISILLIIIIAGYIAIRSYLNPARIRAIAEKVAAEALQRPVQIGTVGLRFGLKVGITVNDVSIANTKGFSSEPVVEIERATMNLKLLPLLQRKIIISGLDFNGLAVNIERDRAGTYNFAALIPKEQKGSDWALSLSQISIRDGIVNYKDAQDNAEIRIRGLAQDITFRGHRIHIKGRSMIDILKHGVLPQTTAKLENAVSYDTLKQILHIDKTILEHDAMNMKVSGSIDKMDLVSLNAELKISDLDKIKSFIPVQSRPAELTGALKADGSILGSVKDPKIDGRCELHHVKIVPAGMLRGLENIDGSLSFDKDAIRNIIMQGEIGNASLNISGSITGLNAPVLGVTVKIDGDLHDFEVLIPEMEDVKMKGPLNADVRVSGPVNDPAFAGSYKITNAQIDGIGTSKPVTDFNMNGTLAQDNVIIEACSGHIGRSDFSFHGSISRFNDPLVEVTNQSNIIDLDELMPPEPASQQNEGVPITIQGNITINTLSGLDMVYKNVRGYFSIGKGLVDLSKCSADAFDGHVNLDMHYNANSPEPYQISSRMTSVSAQKLFKRFLKVESIEGTVSGIGNFSGKGLNAKEVIANMSASGNVSLSKGAFNNFEVLTQLLAWLGMQDQKNVPIQDLSASYSIQNGKVGVNDWALSASYGDFLWNGSLGLNGSLNLILTTTLAKKYSDIVKQHHGDWIFFIDKQGRAVIDLKVTGTFTSPKFSLDKDKIKKRIQGKVKDEFDKKKKDVEKKIDEQKKEWEKKVDEEKKKWEKKIKGLIPR